MLNIIIVILISKQHFLLTIHSFCCIFSVISVLFFKAMRAMNARFGVRCESYLQQKHTNVSDVHHHNSGII